MDARIEQHIIGAYSSGRPLPAQEAQRLRPRDLEHPLAISIMAGIEQVRRNHPGASADTVIEHIGGWATESGVTAAAMRGWCQQTITDHELAVLMRYAICHGAAREVKQWGLQIATSIVMRGWDEGDTRHYQQHLEAAITRRYDDVAFAFAPDPDRISIIDRYMFPDPLPAQEPTTQRVQAEEDILMHLTATKGLCWAAAGVIDESMFTSPTRREVFRAAELIDRQGSYGDDRIAAAAAEIMTARSYGVANPETDRGPQEALAILDRIGSRIDTEVPGRHAIELGRDLLAEDLRRSLATANWNHGIPERHDFPPGHPLEIPAHHHHNPGPAPKT